MESRTKAADIERHFFEQFRKVYSLPDGAIEYGDKPDVIVRGDKSTGIEITCLYVKSGAALESEQRQRSLREMVLSQAHALHRESFGRNNAIWVSFDTQVPITPTRAKEMPAPLAKFVGQSNADESGELDTASLREELPEIMSIYLVAHERDVASWQVLQVHSVEAASAENIETNVKAKERKCATYRACDAYWLLIVVDSINAAQEQEIRIDGLKLESSVFERIILYKPNFEHVVELKT